MSEAKFERFHELLGLSSPLNCSWWVARCWCDGANALSHVQSAAGLSLFNGSMLSSKITSRASRGTKAGTTATSSSLADWVDRCSSSATLQNNNSRFGLSSCCFAI